MRAFTPGLCAVLAMAILAGCPDDPEEATVTPVDSGTVELRSDSGGVNDAQRAQDALSDVTGDAPGSDSPGPDVSSDTSVGGDTSGADTSDGASSVDTSSPDGSIADDTLVDASADALSPDADPPDVPTAGDGSAGETSPSADTGGADNAPADNGSDDIGATDSGPSSGALGDPCSSAADCDSGYCFQPLNFGGAVCSTCGALAGCNLGSVCALNEDLGYAQCTGFGPLGTSCSDGGGCASGFCNGDLCSECESDDHCAGGSCVESAPGAYYECQGGLGDDCSANPDCASGFCYGGPDGDVCSQCTADADCDTGEACLYDADGLLSNGVGYAICEPVDQLGDPCTADGDCASGFCYSPSGFGSDACSECKVDADCPTSNFTCDYALLVGYAQCNGSAGNGAACTLDEECADGSCVSNLCVGELGSPCTTGSACASGFCGANLTQLQPSVCSECEQDNDCNGASCNFDFLAGYRVCQ